MQYLFPCKRNKTAFHDRGARSSETWWKECTDGSAGTSASWFRRYLEKGKVQDIAICRKLHILKISRLFAGVWKSKHNMLAGSSVIPGCSYQRPVGATTQFWFFGVGSAHCYCRWVIRLTKRWLVGSEVCQSMSKYLARKDHTSKPFPPQKKNQHVP